MHNKNTHANWTVVEFVVFHGVGGSTSVAGDFGGVGNGFSFI